MAIDPSSNKIKHALLANQPYELELLVTFGTKIAKISTIAQDAIRERPQDKDVITTNIEILQKWAASHQRDTEQLSDVVEHIFKREDLNEAAKEIRLYFSLGGTGSQLAALGLKDDQTLLIKFFETLRRAAIMPTFDGHCHVNKIQRYLETALTPIKNTPGFIHILCNSGFFKLALELNKLGVSLDSPLPETGDTALHQAIIQDNRELVFKLLKAGANKDKPRVDLNTPLHLAVAYNQIEVVRFLLDAGCGINPANNEGVTPLHYAEDKPEIFRLLMNYGADPTIQDTNGKAPIIDEAYPVHPSGLLKLGEISSVKPPCGMTQAIWESELEGIQVNTLLTLFDTINFDHPDQPGYRNLELNKDSDGHTYTKAELRQRLETFVKEIVNNVPKLGTPSIDLENPKKELEAIESTLLETAVDKDGVSALFSTLYDFIDNEKPAPDITDAVTELTALESNNKKLLKILHSAIELKKWYNFVTETVKSIIYHLKNLEPYSDPTPFAPTVIELAFAGTHCGTRYQDESYHLNLQLHDTPPDLQTQIFSILQKKHHCIAESLVKRTEAHNVHILNNILRIIDENAGITDTDKPKRYYFRDPFSGIYLESDRLQIIKVHRANYSATNILEALTDASISQELLIDWFKENVPDNWDKTPYDYLEEVVDYETGKIKPSAMLYLLQKLNILA